MLFSVLSACLLTHFDKRFSFNCTGSTIYICDFGFELLSCQHWPCHCLASFRVFLEDLCNELSMTVKTFILVKIFDLFLRHKDGNHAKLFWAVP